MRRMTGQSGHQAGEQTGGQARRWPSVWLAAILLGHLFLAGAYSVLNPLGEAPDEADHWAFVLYLGEERALPEGPAVTQSKHPPLYHAAAAAIASLAGPHTFFQRSNPDVELAPRPGWSPNFFIHTRDEDWPWQGGARAMHLARLLSAVLSTATVAATYALGRLAFPRAPLLALAAAGVLAFLPEFLFIGAAVNNDIAAALFGTLALVSAFAIWRGGGRFRPGWWAPLALGFGLLAKVSTLALWPAVAVAIVLGGAEDAAGGGGYLGRIRAGRRRWLGTGLLVFVPGLLIASPWLLRNWRLYGDPLGTALARQTIDLRTAPWTWADTVWLARGWFVSFWGKFGGAGHIPMAEGVYALLLVATGIAMLGLGRVWLSARWRTDGAAVGVLLLAVASVAVAMWQYSLTALGTDQGRLLYPAVAPLVLLWVLGLWVWLPVRWERLGAAGLVLASAALGLYGLWGVIVPAFAPPAPAPAEEWQTAAQEPVQFGDLELVAWDLAEEPVLYWRVRQPAKDLRTELRVVAEDGREAWAWKRSPGAGRWSTDRWPPGVVVRDEYRVRWPEWAGPGRYRVEVGVRPYDGELRSPLQEGKPVLPADTSLLFLGWIQRE